MDGSVSGVLNVAQCAASHALNVASGTCRYRFTFLTMHFLRHRSQGQQYMHSRRGHIAMQNRTTRGSSRPGGTACLTPHSMHSITFAGTVVVAAAIATPTRGAVAECGDDASCNRRLRRRRELQSTMGQRWHRRRELQSWNAARSMGAVYCKTDSSQNGYGRWLVVMLMMLIIVAICLFPFVCPSGRQQKCKRHRIHPIPNSMGRSPLPFMGWGWGGCAP